MEPETRVKASVGVLSTQLDGEAVLMHVAQGIYFGLNEVGAFVWQLMAQPVSVQALCQAVEEEFEVDAASCLQDILALMAELEKDGLVEVCGTEG